ncbi:OmpA family protein [Sphingobacteriaceae bacterium WQ 2009]|uniref:OmpA family protein n=1 Tax=Rhinopithecimicrobium faecis TaxID=2820698 RepID=A0A8T4H5W9_9SPHI|nr:OmpA family protein [Sphingobacteriaceae bacterium WQ 2009]
MKRHLLIALSLFGFSSAWSQTIKSDTTVVEKGRYKVETNRFFDNWFVGFGAGAQMMFTDHDKQADLKDRLTPSYSFYVGKSFSPGIAVRAGVNGLKAKGLTQNGSFTTGEVYDASQRLSVQEIEYYQVNADVLFDVTNIFGGYRPSRFYNISPYIGVGLVKTTVGSKNRDVSANLGIFNAFKVAKVLDITLDVRGSLVNERFDGESGHRKEDGILSAALGLRFKFNETGWNKATTTTVKETQVVYDEAELNKLRDQVNALANDKAALQRIIDGKDGIKVQNKIIAAPILLTFPINKSTVSNDMRVNLKFFSDVIKQGGSNVKYKITGYADKGTGSVATNERLSNERANAIYKVLVNEFNVSPSQLEVEAKGGVDNMFYDDPRVSRAVITIGY